MQPISNKYFDKKIVHKRTSPSRYYICRLKKPKIKIIEVNLMSKKPTKTTDKANGSQTMTNNQSMENKKTPSSSNCKDSVTDCGR